MRELLDRLKQVDPTTYKRFDEETIATRWIYTPDGGEDVESYGCNLSEAAQTAWLQVCLQDAILARGWHFQQLAREGRCVVDITVFEPKCDIIDGPERKTPAEAMLAAYIAACEAI